MSAAIGSIATRLIVFAVALVALTATLIGALSYARARAALETTARAKLALLAHDVAAHLQREVEDRAADTTNWAQLEVMRALIYQDIDKQLVQFLEQTLRGRPTLRGIACRDDQGRVIAGTGDVSALRPPTPARTPGVTIVPDARAGLVHLETAVFNPERSGDMIGTLAVLLDPHRMLDATRGVTPGVTLTLRARDGHVIAEARPSAEPAREPALTAVAAVGQPPGTDAVGLEVVVSQPVAAAFADVASLRATLLRTGLLVAVVGAVLAALLAWRMARPIRQLTATVRDVAQRGEPVVHAAFPQAGGEVGVLASAFRSMMESLASAQREALARSRLALLGEVAANIAHEVRTPLSVLKTSAQLLARGGMPAEEQRELASMAAAEVDRLNAVVTNLVDLARPRPVRHRIESVDAIVERAVSFFQPLAAEKGVDVVRGGDGGLRVHASADQLHQVLLNFLQNAVQALPGPGTISVTTRGDAHSVLVAVEDTGPGFAPEVLARVFTPFVTTKEDGTGLGLAIVKRMIEEHGGSVGAENRAGGGARVWFRLPRREDAT